MKKNLNIELIKILSCFAVVGLHTFWFEGSRFNMLSYYLMSFAVPLFFMVNGYLILNKSSMSWNYILHKELQYIRIIVGWNLIWFCITAIRYRVWENPFRWILDSLVQRGRLWQFWFFGSIMILYLVVPFVYRLIRINQWILPGMIIVLLVVCCLVDFISLLLGRTIQYGIFQTFRVWTWWFYFLLGAYIKRLEYNIRQIETKKTMLIRSAVSIGALLLSCLYQYYSSRYLIHNVMCEFHYDNILVICANMLLFILILLLPIKESWNDMICRLGRLTLGVYIVHPILYQIFVTLVIAIRPAGMYLFSYLILTVSVIVTEIILRCPYIRKLVSLE